MAMYMEFTCTFIISFRIVKRIAHHFVNMFKACFKRSFHYFVIKFEPIQTIFLYLI